MQYLDDFKAGQRFATAAMTVTPEAVAAFATSYDPQPFHLDPQAGSESIFGEMVASGWHTAAVTMRLLVDSDFRPVNGIVGFRIDNLSWARPVRPGDRLHLELEVLEVTPSRSKPDRGVLGLRIQTFNQEHEPVQDMTANLLVYRKT